MFATSCVTSGVPMLNTKTQSICVSMGGRAWVVLLRKAELRTLALWKDADQFTAGGEEREETCRRGRQACRPGS